MHLTPLRFAAVLTAFALALVLVFVAALGAGPSALGFGEIIDALRAPDASGAAGDIVWRIRAPRIALAALVGAALSTSGAIFQALLRNPLADPFVLGVSGGAALAAVATLAFGATVGLPPTAAPVAAFAGAIATTFLLYNIAGGRGRIAATSLLLTGVVFNAFASAVIVFLVSLAGRNEGAQAFLWLVGNLSAARSDLALPVALFLGLGLGVAFALARSLNLLALGDEPAELLGVATARHQRMLLVATSLMVGAAVSVSGLVGFVGLIVPHALRLVLGPDHRLLIPTSALGGAAFLVACDTVARSILGGPELPVGAITALLGGPFFLFLLRRQSAQVFAP